MSPNRTCSVNECERFVHGGHLCHTHYMRRRVGKPLGGPIQPRATVCSIEGCERSNGMGRGWCRLHYDRWRRHGDPLYERGGLPCSQQNCDRPHFGKGYCAAHYSRLRRGLPMDAPLKRRSWAGVTCSQNGCDRPAKSRGLCQRHYLPVFRTETGKVYRSGSGSYEQVWIDGRPIQRHRLIMEEILGRPLAVYENVHHLNGIRDDNRPDNLELWAVPQPCGQRPEDLARWVIEAYPELVVALLTT